jgi:alkylated DNA repair protein alkB family protein 8
MEKKKAQNEEENNMAASRLRSLLPHEPIPVQERPGFILVQGAFTPKTTGKKTTTTTSHDGEDDEKAESLMLLDFWSVESLTLVLVSRLNRLLASAAAHSSLFANDPILGAEVHDASPPYTKVCLQCESTDLANRLCAVFRTMTLSPLSVFSQGPEFRSASSSSNSAVAFGSRPFQLIQLTKQPLPPLDQAWNRSNPPKFRRLIPRPGEDVSALEKERSETRFVFISDILASDSHEGECWHDPRAVVQAVRDLMVRHDVSGLGVEVFVSRNKLRHCHVGMRSPRDARALMTALQGTVVELFYVDPVTGRQHKATSGRLFLDYAAITHRSVARAQARLAGRELEKGSPPSSECTSLTDHVTIPGLHVIPEYVTPDEESLLFSVLTGPQAPWAPTQSTPTTGRTVRRKVQHYGYVFDYKTANVLRDRTARGADCPCLPELPDGLKSSADNNALEDAMKRAVAVGDGWEALACLIERTRRFEFRHDPSTTQSFPHLNQLTVNLYRPGEGIGSHVDTPSAFGDGLISVSLSGGIVMEFRKVSGAGDGKDKRLVYLPPRSLLLMSGAARYEWEHMIVTRSTDTVNGRVLPRQRRLSLTLRTALTEFGEPMPTVSSRVFPPAWGFARSRESNPFVTPDCERDHVHSVYDAIASQWHHTRGRRGVLWPGATLFLQRLPPGSVVADVGCGDGKYFPAIWEAGSYVIGTDISLPLLKTSMSSTETDDSVPKNRQVGIDRHHLRVRPAVAVADCMSVPLRTGSCDAAICIAVLHHISTASRRKRCIEELARIVKPGGMINIQAWALDQEEDSRHKFVSNDVFVPFNAQPKYLALEDIHRNGGDAEHNNMINSAKTKSTAEQYAEAFNAEYDDQKGLVVFKRYCHLYKKGELDHLCAQLPNVKVVDSGFESGNYFVVAKVIC